MKCRNYEGKTFAQLLLLNFEMLSLWCTVQWPHEEEYAYGYICIFDWNWCFHNLNNHKLGINDWSPSAHFLVVLLKDDWPSMAIVKSSRKTIMKVMKL
jgi:hypothetical protein